MSDDPHQRAADRIQARISRLHARAERADADNLDAQLAALDSAIRAQAELARMKEAQASAPLTDPDIVISPEA